MGIPKFYKQYILRDVREAVLQRLPQIDNFYIDMNSLLHQAAGECFGYQPKNEPLMKIYIDRYYARTDDLSFRIQCETNLRNKIEEVLIDLMKKIKPENLSYIAIDGVAPQSKIAQQRYRRFKRDIDLTKPYKEFYYPKDNTNPTNIVYFGAGGIIFDSNSITPGTDLMFKIDKWLTEIITIYKSLFGKTIVYSNHMVPGEGEHKIMQFLRSDKTYQTGKNTCIYGNDADLIVLSMLSPINKIFLYRESYDIREITEFTQDTFKELKNIEIINIEAFKKHVNKVISSKQSYKDFALIVGMFGSDFLPQQLIIREIDDLKNLLKLLYKYDKPLVTDAGDIIESNFKEFIKELAGLEKDLYTDLYHNTLNSKWIINPILTQSVTDKNIFDFNTYYKKYYKIEFEYKANIQLDFEKITGKKFSITDTITNMVKEYLNGLQWIMHYYTRPFYEVNLGWYYPYYKAPFILSIHDYLKNNSLPRGHIADVGNAFPNVYHQLIAVIPEYSRACLPKDLITFLNTHVLDDLYPTSYLMDINGRPSYDAISYIPFADFDRIKKLIGGMGLPEKYNFINPVILSSK